MKRNFQYRITILIFCISIIGIIYIPIFGGFGLPLSQNSNTEKRTLTEKPEIRLSSLQFHDQGILVYIQQFLKNYEKYFSDSYPFRSTLIRFNSWIMVYFFGESPLPQKVSIGKNGWFYFMGEQSVSVDRHLNIFSESELTTIKSNLLKRAQYFRQQNIQYYFILTPDKPTIYPEFLPLALSVIQNVSKYDQILKLTKENEIDTIDLRPSLIAAKKNYPVYYKTDTHWNAYGAYIAFKDIVKILQIPYSEKDRKVDITSVIQKGGDLALMLGLADMLKEKYPIVRIKSEGIINNGNANTYLESPLVILNSSGRHETLLVFRDSFFSSIIPYLSGMFQKSVFIMGVTNSADVEKYHPDIVIEQLVERHINTLKMPPF